MSGFKRIINVIPLTRVKLGPTQAFSYLVPLKLEEQLRPGQLAEISFGSRRITGVISSFEMHRLPKETKGMKELTGLLEAAPVFSEKSLALASWLAEYYVVSLGLVLKAMLPKFAKNPKEPPMRGFEKYNPDFVLTEQQRIAVSQISAAVGKCQTFLLFGVTGSGKTEIYMQTIERVLESEKQVIMLVPEISLTTQAVERFARRFGIKNLAILGSQLTDSERTYMWREIREKKRNIIIGPRSAIFAPVQDLGLIILDEEHDSSYKQFDQNPKYSARSVALKLSELWSCPLVLGDATPSVETFYAAVSGSKPQATLLTLPYRIKADVGLPRVKIIDMREELKGGNVSIFSDALKYAILDNLRKKKQVLLFLNRRGAATFVMCRDCGHVETCTVCAVPLVYHLSNKKLICHHCGRRAEPPAACPACHGLRIKYFGLGTQMVEHELKKLLQLEPDMKSAPRVERMDRDSTAAVGTGPKLYEAWKDGKIDILIGTQIVSKGWDVANVGLVGVISADTTLHLPDFRSNERTFQVLTQVAGRTGRGDDHGDVILQTYNPDNFAIKTAKMHDYESFYKIEIAERNKFGYPPFSRLVKLTIKNPSQQKAQALALETAKDLLARRDFPAEILGPVPAFLPKIQNQYQMRIILKTRQEDTGALFQLLKDLPGYVDIDVDPETIL